MKTIIVIAETKRHFYRWVQETISGLDHTDWQYNKSSNRLRIKDKTYFYVLDDIRLAGVRFTGRMILGYIKNCKLIAHVDEIVKHNKLYEEIK